MRIYLAGPINDCTDGQAHGWRDIVMGALEKYHTFANPMVRDYRGKEAEHVADIVDGDLADLATCDLLLAYCWKPSYGTAMEIWHAVRDLRIPVHAVCAPPVSPWVAYHAIVHATLGDAIVALAKLGERAA